MQRLIERVRELRRVTGGSTNCGWMVDEVSILLYALVKFNKPTLIIQTGHLWGKSALVCLEALTDGISLEGERQNSDRVFDRFVDSHKPNRPSYSVLSIDPHSEGVPHWQAGIDLLESWYPGRFVFFNMTSGNFFKDNEVNHGVNVMTIIDGDHSPEGCRADLEASARIGAKLIFLDDIDWLVHIGDAGERFARDNHYTYTPFHLYNGVALLSR